MNKQHTISTLIPRKARGLITGKQHGESNTERHHMLHFCDTVVQSCREYTENPEYSHWQSFAGILPFSSSRGYTSMGRPKAGVNSSKSPIHNSLCHLPKLATEAMTNVSVQYC